MMNKAELERIWNEEPVGYMKRLNKSKKKLKKFRVHMVKVSFQPNSMNFNFPDDTIIAKNQVEANDKFRMENYSRLITDAKQLNNHRDDGFYSLQFRTTEATE